MELLIGRKFSNLTQVDLVDGSTKIDLGLLNDAERKILAETLLSAVNELCYNDMPTEEYRSWIEENT